MSTLIPLKKIDVRADVLDGIAKVVLTCKFENNQFYPVNPIHYFSLDCNATINKLQMEIGDRILTSITKEKSTARKEYNDATKEGKKASLIEKLSDNDYMLQIGNVNSGESINVNIEYITTLECNQNGSYIFVFPTNISVKYFSSKNVTREDMLYSHKLQKMEYSNCITYNYTFEVNWKSAKKILGVEAPVDLCQIEYDDNKVHITSVGNPLKGDFVVAVKTEHKPCVYYYEDEKTKDIYALTTIRVDKPNEIPENRLKKDYKIIVDCSGSMDAQFNNTTKMIVTIDSIIQFLNLLNENDYFNITFFGSTFKRWLPASVKATRNAKFSAIENIKKITANLGGTELFDCLIDSIVSTENFDNEQCEKVIVIFTDGQIGNYTGLIKEIEFNYSFCNDFSLAMCTGNSDNEIKAKYLVNNRFRIFTIGLGDDVDRKLIKKLADVTGGLYVYVKDAFKMQNTLEYIVSNINAKYYLNARLDNEPNNTNIYSAMYPNKNYIFLKKISQNQLKNLEENGITLLCTNSKTNAPIRCNVKFNKFIKKGNELKQLYSNLVIKNLEHALEFCELSYTEYNECTHNVINLSIKENIMSKYTSFLIIDDKKTTFAPSVDCVVPHYSSNHVQLSNTQSSGGVRCEEVDALDGGMDMFGGGGGGGGGGYYSSYYTGEKDFVPYKTEIDRNNLIHSLNHANTNKMLYIDHTFVCYKSYEDLNKDSIKMKISIELYYNIIMYFALNEHKDLQDHAYQLLCAICKSGPNLNSFQLLKSRMLYNEYINLLKIENNKRTYRYHSYYCGDY